MTRFSCFLLAVSALICSTVTHAANWPSFRGVDGNGLGDGDPPTAWDVASGSNVVWKVPVEGLANASPIIWENRIFLVTAVSSAANPTFETDPTWGRGIVDGDTPWIWKVLCFDKTTGKRLWEKVAHTGLPKQKRHSESTQANCTPATDGRHVVAMFGSEGMFCYSLDGELLWKKDLGSLRATPGTDTTLEWGFASSPIIHQSTVIMQCDVVGGGFVALLDIRTGNEIRRIRRDDVPTWATPTVYGQGEHAQLVCNGYKQIAGYDLLTGKELWHLAGRGDIPVPRPVVADGLIFITSNHKGRATYAVKPSSRGDITPSSDGNLPEGLAWWNARLGSYMPVPLVYEDILYVPDERGMVSAFEAATGKPYYTQERWVAGEGARYYASPVAAAGRIYQPNLKGEIHVLKAGKQFERLVTNQMGESCYATPAISQGQLFIRTRSQLYCIGRM